MRFARIAWLALCLLLCLLSAGTVPVFAQDLDGSAETGSLAAPDPSPHQVAMSNGALVVTWTSDAPETGWLEYGSTPDVLDQVASAAEGSAVATTQHQVTIGDLRPGSTLYYVVVRNSQRTMKGGQPYAVYIGIEEQVEAAATGDRPLTAEPLGLSLMIPAGWNGSLVDLAGEIDPIVELSDGATGSLVIVRQPNPLALTPAQWFEAHRFDYHPTLAAPVTQTTVGGEAALVIGQPVSCDTIPMLATFIPHAGAMYAVMFYDDTTQATIPAYATVLGSLTFGDSVAAGWQPADLATATFPVAAADVVCPASAQGAESVSAAVRCSSSDMYFPSSGVMRLPWNCFNDSLCSPYSSTAADEYNRKPHRGLDIFGTEGVTPVYATYSGYAYKVNTSNIKLVFDGIYSGKSAWYAHMASSNGAVDYRQLPATGRVTAGLQIGKIGNYKAGGGPHVHISYVNNANGTEAWPSLDPTKFLSGRNMVWYPGWNFSTSAISCSGTSADGYEPDNFQTNARTFALGSAPERHTFHAPGDQDWFKFTASAGRGYRIVTRNLGSRNDTYLYLYDASMRYITHNDDADGADGALASRIDWVAPASGTYYVKVIHYSFANSACRPVSGVTPANCEYGDTSSMIRYSVPTYGASTNYDFEILTNIVKLRPAYATSSDSGYGARNGNDGSGNTRWASGCTVNDPEWLWFDLGSYGSGSSSTGNASFNQVFINFETAYATRYAIYWWNPGDASALGYAYTANSAGLKLHRFGSPVTGKRYMGVLMSQRPWQYCNYSIWEVAAYRMPATLAAAEVDPEMIGPAEYVEQTPEGELMEIPAPSLLPAAPSAPPVQPIFLPLINR